MRHLLSEVNRRVDIFLQSTVASREVLRSHGHRRNPLYRIGLYKPTRFTCRDDLRLTTCSTSIEFRVLAAGAPRLSC